MRTRSVPVRMLNVYGGCLQDVVNPERNQPAEPDPEDRDQNV